MVQTHPPRWETFAAARLGAARLTVFRGVLEGTVGSAFLRLLHLLEVPTSRPDDLLAAYGAAFAALASVSDESTLDDAWQDYVLDRLLVDDNAFSRQAQRTEVAIAPGLRAAAMADLAVLQRLFELDAQTMVDAVTTRLGPLANAVMPLVPWRGIGLRSRVDDDAAEIRRRFAAHGDWPALVDDLAAHYAMAGAGLFARYRAFRWVHDRNGARLEGIARPDPVRLEDLVGYERERALLVQNTEQFVAGYPANNVLLYGDRGTGKSSTVKALLAAFADRGLRLVEVAKQDLADFPAILAQLRDRRERFILFVDDLSFEERETEYKHLKALLEGSLEARPDNVLLYATSNRRHLVVERFTDRGEPGDELHTFDATQEKLSLSDRFGITITFTAPSQEMYLAIVAALAERRGLPIEPAELRARAIAWSQQQRARSGRTARQFIDHLTGALALARR